MEPNSREQEAIEFGGWALDQLKGFFGLPADATDPMIDRCVYKGTSCGASFMQMTNGGWLFSTIVEGSDAEDAVEVEWMDLMDEEPAAARAILHDRVDTALRVLEDFADEHFEEWAAAEPLATAMAPTLDGGMKGVTQP